MKYINAKQHINFGKIIDLILTAEINLLTVTTRLISWEQVLAPHTHFLVINLLTVTTGLISWEQGLAPHTHFLGTRTSISHLWMI